MVLQDAWLFKGTIRENVLYGAPGRREERFQAAAEAAHVDHFVRTLPDGYETVLDDDATNVSAGEKQLLTIARAFLADPPVLILDEATSSVDTRTEVLIQRAMNRLMEGRTSFVIAHRLSTIRDADVILVMNKGRIVEQGTHDELLAKRRLLPRALRVASSRRRSSPSRSPRGCRASRHPPPRDLRRRRHRRRRRCVRRSRPVAGGLGHWPGVGRTFGWFTHAGALPHPRDRPVRRQWAVARPIVRGCRPRDQIVNEPAPCAIAGGGDCRTHRRERPAGARHGGRRTRHAAGSPSRHHHHGRGDPGDGQPARQRRQPAARAR